MIKKNLINLYSQKIHSFYFLIFKNEPQNYPRAGKEEVGFLIHAVLSFLPCRVTKETLLPVSSVSALYTVWVAASRLSHTSKESDFPFKLSIEVKAKSTLAIPVLSAMKCLISSEIKQLQPFCWQKLWPLKRGAIMFLFHQGRQWSRERWPDQHYLSSSLLWCCWAAKAQRLVAPWTSQTFGSSSPLAFCTGYSITTNSSYPILLHSADSVKHCWQFHTELKGSTHHPHKPWRLHAVAPNPCR